MFRINSKTQIKIHTNSEMDDKFPLAAPFEGGNGWHLEVLWVNDSGEKMQTFIPFTAPCNLDILWKEVYKRHPERLDPVVSLEDIIEHLVNKTLEN